MTGYDEERGVDRNALSYWLPRIEAAGLPVPRTTLVEMNEAAFMGLCAIFDGKDSGDDYRSFIRALEDAAIHDPHRVAEAFPLFLRSDYTSAKHEWSKSCFVTDIPAIDTAVRSIAYFSMCVGCPLPIGSKWAIRELLPIMPVTWCPNFAGMPVNREFRFFADEHGARAYQPYWPEQALLDGGAPNRPRWPLLWEMSPEEMVELRDLAEKAAKAAGPGEWSVDLLETERGWFVTDMAAADSSYRGDQIRVLSSTHERQRP